MALRRARVPEPCRGCRFAPRCRADKLACDAAAGWAAGLSEIRWRAAPRAPTRARLEAIIEIEQRQRRERAAQSQGSSRRWQEPKSAVICEPGIRIGEISRELEKAHKVGTGNHIQFPSDGKSKAATLRDAGSCGMLDVSHARGLPTRSLGVVSRPAVVRARSGGACPRLCAARIST